MSEHEAATQIIGPGNGPAPVRLSTTTPEPWPAPIEEPPLFDPAPFTVPIFDGQRSDKLTIAFTGSFSYDIGDPEGEALFAKLTLGHEVELRVSGTVVSKAGRYSRSKDEVETITGYAGVKIDTLYAPSPQELD